MKRNLPVAGMLAMVASASLAAGEPDKRATASPPGSGSASGSALAVSSSFKSGAVVPKKYTGDGADVSPPLRWSAVPSATHSIAVICYDPDAPRGRWYHWLLWNLPGNTSSLNESVPKNATVFGVACQGTNDFNKIGYNGPAPPPRQTHHYHYQVMALDGNVDAKPGAKKEEVLAAIQKRGILAQGELVAIYWR